jgi:pSer/pThr/pTyr-binding forkhead associated (FHA) protein
MTNIGSADGNSIIILDKSVSKRHAGIKVQDNRFELADFGSTNGVLVNGQRVTKQFLKSGDLLSIGAVEMEFTLKT